MELPKQEMSLKVILSIIGEEDLRNAEFCKQLLKRAFQEGDDSVTRALLEKISRIFIFSDEKYRKELLEYAYTFAQHLKTEELINLSRESVFGNILMIYYFVKQISPLTSEKIEKFVKLSELKYVYDPLTLEMVPAKEMMLLDLDEKVASINKLVDIERCIELCELLFANDIIVKTFDTIASMLILYKSASKPELRIKGEIVSALLEKKLDVFLNLIQKVKNEVKDKDALIQQYEDIYDFLHKVRLPVFFDFEKVLIEFSTLYNGNFFFAKVLNKTGEVELVQPFDKINAIHVQKIYDPITRKFVIPRKRAGKLLLRDIFSFRKVGEVTQISEEQIAFVKKLRETEIELKIREILHDQNLTTHSPAENVDVYTLKLYVNNENDLRDAGMILKGKGFPKVNLKVVAPNILKAMDLPIHIVFLIHTGILDDVAREKFINQCNLAKKMYCIVDAEDLARLLIAYNKMPSSS
jgi:hypothetical protein